MNRNKEKGRERERKKSNKEEKERKVKYRFIHVFLLGRKTVEPQVKLCMANFMIKNMLLAISLSDAKIP